MSGLDHPSVRIMPLDCPRDNHKPCPISAAEEGMGSLDVKVAADLGFERDDHEAKHHVNDSPPPYNEYGSAHATAAPPKCQTKRKHKRSIAVALILLIIVIIVASVVGSVLG
jgi:hypothetical protein